MAALLHGNANVVGQELTPQPLLPLPARALCRRSCCVDRRRRPRFVGHGRRHPVAAGAAAGSAAAPVAAAGAWADAVTAGDVVARALDVAHADAGDEEAPVGGDVGARGVDGDVAGPAQQGAVLQAEEVARLLLPAPTSGRSSSACKKPKRRGRNQHAARQNKLCSIHIVMLRSKFLTFFFTARKFIYGDSVFIQIYNHFN